MKRKREKEEEQLEGLSIKESMARLFYGEC